MIRLFVGLPLPDEVRSRLAVLCAGLPGVRWVAPENLHVTLRFIGEIEEHVGQEVHARLVTVRAPAFALDLAGLGTFGRERRPRALWIGVERHPALLHLHDRIESAVVRAGLAPEQRKFSPHVTLARLKEAPGPRLGAFVAGNATVRVGPVAFDRFTLYSSRLGRAGAAYAAEAEYPLDGES